jgi:hypothetical protein
MTGINIFLTWTHLSKKLFSPPYGYHPPTKPQMNTANAPAVTNTLTRPHTLREYVDPNVLEALIKLPIPKVQGNVPLLKRYRDTGRGGERIVTYKPSAHGIGRLYADKGLSMQSFPRCIRHTLAKTLEGIPLYHDIDMVNAHPVILLQLCQNQGWTAECLETYVHHREKELQSVALEFSVNRETAKELFLRLMYGGSFYQWAKDCNQDRHVPTPFVATFQSELASIMNQIWEHKEFVGYRNISELQSSNQDDDTSVEALISKNEKARCMSLAVQSIENQILMVMEGFFESRDYETSVRVFDGLQLRAKKAKLPDHLLRECEARIQAATQFKIRLSEKAMDESFDVRTLACITGPESENTWRHKYTALLLQCLNARRWNTSAGLQKITELAFVAGASLQSVHDAFPNKKQESRALFDDLTQRLALSKVEASDTGETKTEQQAWAKQQEDKQHEWMNAIKTLEKMAQVDHLSQFLKNRPIFDLRCPYTIDDLLNAKTKERATFLTPKVLARITGEETELWIKKTRKIDGTVRFVNMKNGLQILRHQVYVSKPKDNPENKPQSPKDAKSVPVQTVVIETANKRGVEMNFSQADFVPYSNINNPPQLGGNFNMFGGFPFHEMPGSFDSIDWSPIQAFLDFVRIVFCSEPKYLTDPNGEVNGHEQHNQVTKQKYDELWNIIQDFFSDMVQYPERKPRVCLVLYSKEQQIGKSALVRLLCNTLCGRYFKQVDDENHILGDFTSTLAKHMIINIDESSKRGKSYEQCGKLKNKITEPECSITYKGADPFTITSCHRYIYTVNYKDAINVELFDARFLITECDPRFRSQKEVFDAIENMVTKYGALIWNYFRKRPLNKHWNKVIPMTDIKRNILESKFPSIVQFVIKSPIFWSGQQALIKPAEIAWHLDELYHNYREWSREEQIECGIYRQPQSMEEPLQLINITLGADSGRVRIKGSNKPSKGRDKGFCVNRANLIASIKEFLTKMGESGASDWQPPDETEN